MEVLKRVEEKYAIRIHTSEFGPLNNGYEADTLDTEDAASKGNYKFEFLTASDSGQFKVLGSIFGQE